MGAVVAQPTMSIEIPSLTAHVPESEKAMRLTDPGAPAVKVMDGVPWPPVIVPLKIVQVKKPVPPLADAVFPVENATTVAGAVITIGGGASVSRRCVSVAVQPEGDITVTLYVRAVVGETVIEGVVSPPGDHKYEAMLLPLAVSVTGRPAPHDDAGPKMLTVGPGLTAITVGAEVAEQPLASVIVTV